MCPYIIESFDLNVMQGVKTVAVFPATLKWAESSPLSVTLGVDQREDGYEVTEWVFARELLLDAIVGESFGSAGEGDVQLVAKSPLNRLYIRMSGVEGRSVSYIPLGVAKAFLSHTEAVVPVGQESLEGPLDDAITQILKAY